MAEEQTAVSSPYVVPALPQAHPDTIPVNPETRMTTEEIAARDANAPSLMEAAKLGTTEWLHNYIPQIMLPSDGEKIELTPQMLDEAGVSAMPEAYRSHIINNSSTKQEFDFFVAQAKQRMENMEKMAAGGVPQMIAYGLTSALDPTELGATAVLTYGVGGILKAAYAPLEAAATVKNMLALKSSVKEISAISKTASASRTATFVKGGATTAAIGLPFELARTQYLPDYDIEDMGAVLAAMAALGGTGHVMGRANDNMKLAAMLYKREKVNNAPLSEAEKQFYAPVIGLKNLDIAEDRIRKLFDLPDPNAPKVATANAAPTPNVKAGTGLSGAAVGLGLSMKDIIAKAGSDVATKLSDTLPTAAHQKYLGELIAKGKEITYKAAEAKLAKETAILKKLDEPMTDEELIKLGSKGVRKKAEKADNAYLLERGKRMVEQNKKDATIRKETLDHILNDRLERIKQSEVADATPENAIDSTDFAKYENAPFQLGHNFLSGGKAVRARLSSLAEAMQSKIGLVRHMGEALSQNFAGRTNRTAVSQSAEEIAGQIQNQTDAQFLFMHRKNQMEWIRKHGELGGKSKWFNPVVYHKDMMKFNELVSNHIRFKNQTNPSVIASAERAEQILADIYAQAVQAKARGFSMKNVQDNYLPRIYKDVAMDDFIAKNGGGEAGNALFRQKFIDAIAEGNPEMLPEVAERIGKGYADALIKRMRQPRDGQMAMRASSVAEDSIDSVIRIIREEATLTDDVIANIENEVTRLYGAAAEGQQGIARARRRMTLAEHHIAEFLEADVEELLHAYSFQTGGAIGLARNGIDVEGGKDFFTILEDIRKHNQDHRIQSKDVMDREIEALEYMYDSIKGNVSKKNDYFGGAEKTMRRIRDFNFMRVMGATGLTSMIEVGALLDHNFVTIMKATPMLTKIFKKAADGDLSDPLARELGHTMGTGVDVITGHAKSHMDDYESTMIKADYDRWDTLLGKGRQITANLSGMLPLTMVLRRLDTYMFAQDFFQASAKKGKLTYSKIKLEQLGISPEDHEGIMEMIRTHASKDKNGELIALNLKDWSKTAEGDRLYKIFTIAGRRHTLSSIQETSAGSVNRMLRTNTGRTLFQFMSYPMAAAEQQAQRLVTRATHGDAGVVTRVIMAQALMAGLVYYTQVHQRVIGMSEAKKKKYLAERMTPSAIVRDGVLGMMGVSGALSALYGQINQNKLLHAPVLDLANGVGNAFNITRDSIMEGQRPTEGELRSITRIGFLQNWYVSNWVLNGLADKYGR